MLRSTLKLLMLFLLLCPMFLFSQNTPMGWGSLNGGVTGGQGGQTVYVSNRAELLSYLDNSDPYIIMIEDTIDLVLYEMILVWGNKSLIGVGNKGAIRYGGLAIRGDNVILQNLSIYGSYDGDWEGETHGTDAIVLYAKNVWIDHCELSASADGLLDITSRPESVSDYITISWTKFMNHNKMMLIGSWDNSPRDRGHLNTTIHNCWFDGTVERGANNRMPRVRFGKVHVLNNYYENVSHYCASARVEADILVERCYFRNCSDPHTIGDWNIGQEEPELKAEKNIYEVSDDTRTVNGDAFDPKDYYDYTRVGPKKVPAIVMNGAGLFNPPNNKRPVANDDGIFLSPESDRDITIDPTSNDTDQDGGDLRITVILNSPRGKAHIRNNKIEYEAQDFPAETDTIMYELVDTQGGIDTGMVFVFHVLEEEDKEEYPEVLTDANVLNVYPNPVKEQAFIDYTPLSPEDDKVNVRLFDSIGRMYTKEITKSADQPFGNMHRYSVNTSFLAPGIYHIVVTDSQSKHTKKLVISGNGDRF